MIFGFCGLVWFSFLPISVLHSLGPDGTVLPMLKAMQK